LQLLQIRQRKIYFLAKIAENEIGKIAFCKIFYEVEMKLAKPIAADFPHLAPILFLAATLSTLQTSPAIS